MRRFILFGLAVLLAWGCSKDDDPPPPPPPAPLPALDPGEGRLLPEGMTVQKDGTILVHLDVSSGTDVLGALSARVQFNRAAFEMVSVTGPDAVLTDPYLQVETRPGDLYLGWTNTSPPDTNLTGQRRVATITFKAVGGSGARMNLQGEILTLGDTAFPAADIGTSTLPRTLEVVNEVKVE
jgi:hypothetical protein